MEATRPAFRKPVFRSYGGNASSVLQACASGGLRRQSIQQHAAAARLLHDTQPPHRCGCSPTSCLPPLATAADRQQVHLTGAWPDTPK
eukprot:365028-Chlamydomonas_euryale.AAC.30